MHYKFLMSLIYVHLLLISVECKVSLIIQYYPSLTSSTIVLSSFEKQHLTNMLTAFAKLFKYFTTHLVRTFSCINRYKNKILKFHSHFFNKIISNNFVCKRFKSSKCRNSFYLDGGKCVKEMLIFGLVYLS